MLNSKQRAKLRSMANGLETILQIGKGGISDNTVKQINDALLARVPLGRGAAVLRKL